MIIIRKIEPSDYKRTGEMIQTTIRVSYKELYPQLLIQEFCKKYDLENFKSKAADIEMFIAAEGDDIIGVIGIKENQLRTFYVHPDFQGRGIGSKLYRTLEKLAIERGIRKFVLEGSPLGQPIYEHFGFIKIRELEKNRVGQKYVDAVMEKEL